MVPYSTRDESGVLIASLEDPSTLSGLRDLSSRDEIYALIPDRERPLVVAMVTSFACIISLAVCAEQARTHPNNLIFLSIFTLAEGVLVGSACAAYEVEAVVMAVAITALVVGGLVGYAMTTKTDFTGAGPYLFSALWMLVLYGLIVSFFPPLRTLNLAYSAIGVVLFSFYLIYDVQLIVGGKHNKFRFCVDDAVFASLNVYLDIINLFIRILHIVSQMRNRN